MSIKHMSAAFESDLSPSEKLVLLSICDCADDQGMCWPSLKHLSVKCSMSESGISRIIKRLEGVCLHKKKRFGKSTIYTVSIEDQNCTKIKPVFTGDQVQSLPKIKRETSTNLQKKHKGVYTDDFEEFWKAWKQYKIPKGDKKPAMKNYLKAIKLVDKQTLLSKAKSYCKQCNNKKIFTKYISAWLDANGWEDIEEVEEKNPVTEKQMRIWYYQRYGEWKPQWGELPEGLADA